MIVLIITKSDDNESVHLVSEAIEERGGKVFRLDTDCFPTEIKLAAHFGKGTERLVLRSERAEIDLHEVSAIWHRRLNIAARIPANIDPQMRAAAIGESRATLMGMLAGLKAFRMDKVQSIRHAENKQLQLQVARELGLETPRTLITNDPEAVREFARQSKGGLVTKMLSSFAIFEGGREKVVFTNRVAPEDLEDLSGLRLCPMTFQEMVSKALELRVTIAGQKVFSAAIDSQSSERAALDWRRDGVRLIEDWTAYDLPKKIERKLLRLMDRFGLNYGAIDIIVTPEGRHVFLEVNPAGEFFWLEQCPGLPISKAIADVLVGRSPRRQ